ncbi:MAG TPA: hypothetical protein VGB83_07560 [Actinomycetota bacterium]
MRDAPAFYALTGGGWRDWWTLLHPPYTIWHLSYVALGAAAAPSVEPLHVGATLLAFFLAVGLGAHALDELNGRPLGTAIGARTLGAVAVVSVAGAAALGVAGVGRLGPGLVLFIAAGVFLVPAYNLEWLRGRLHTDLWFALAWGAFPALTGGFAMRARLTEAIVATAAGCFFASLAQRALSTPVRAIRRRTRAVDGSIACADGTVEPVTAATLTAPAERALRALSVAMPLLATGALVARL